MALADLELRILLPQPCKSLDSIHTQVYLPPDFALASVCIRNVNSVLGGRRNVLWAFSHYQCVTFLPLIKLCSCSLIVLTQHHLVHLNTLRQTIIPLGKNVGFTASTMAQQAQAFISSLII